MQDTRFKPLVAHKEIEGRFRRIQSGSAKPVVEKRDSIKDVITKTSPESEVDIKANLIKAFDELQGPKINQLLTPYDVELLERTTRDRRLQGLKKINVIDSIMFPRGFKRMSQGTNRIAYRHLENPDIVIKVATSQVGLEDGRHEMIVQEWLKPFVCKCFDVSEGGAVAIYERVIPIIKYNQITESMKKTMASTLDWFFEESSILVGDAGFSRETFKNWGIREGFGPVLLDYPLAVHIDKDADLLCNTTEKGFTCYGSVYYNHDYDKFICNTCGSEHFPNELGLHVEHLMQNILGKQQTINNQNIISEKEKIKMKFRVIRNGVTTKTVDTTVGAIGDTHEYINAIDFETKKRKDTEASSIKTGKLRFHVRKPVQQVVEEEFVEPQPAVYTDSSLEAWAEESTITDEVIEETPEEITPEVIEQTIKEAVSEPNTTKDMIDALLSTSVEDKVEEVVEERVEEEVEEESTDLDPFNVDTEALQKAMSNLQKAMNNEPIEEETPQEEVAEEVIVKEPEETFYEEPSNKSYPAKKKKKKFKVDYSKL